MITDPSDILKVYLKEKVIIRIKSGELYEGMLLGFDEYHSLLLRIDNSTKFIRGENILFIGQTA